jgi:large subunit ribosomal protein L24
MASGSKNWAGNSIIKMKKKFSSKWKASGKQRKQRKYIANAPLHLRRKFISANLSKELRKKYNVRSISLKKGDKIKVMRGKFKKKTGKISTIDLSKARASVEGLQIQKKDGTKVNVFFSASNLQILEMNFDKKRKKSLKADEKKEDKKKPSEKEDKGKKYGGENALEKKESK